MENKNIMNEFEQIAEELRKNTNKILEDYKKRLDELNKKYGDNKK